MAKLKQKAPLKTRGNKNYAALKCLARSLGRDVFGVADISQIKKDFLISARVLESLQFAVCAGVRLSRGVLEELEHSPTRLYFHHYRSINALLDQTATRISHYIEQTGNLALPIPASQIVDWDKQSAHCSHKRIGALAGIGWIGRNNLLVTKKLGSQFRLVTVLTDMPLTSDAPHAFSCGSCRVCIQACPCGAIKEQPSEFDHMRCFAQLKEFQKQRLVDQYICGVCVRVCRGNTVRYRAA
jgi:epoxyqueuosine reductase